MRAKVCGWCSRWTIAAWLNRSPRTCWPNLVDWAMHDAENHKALCDDDECYYRLRNACGLGGSIFSGGARCQAESAMHLDRTCWCAKFVDGCHGAARDEAFQRLQRAEQAQREAVCDG